MSNAEPRGIVPEFTLGDRLRKAREASDMSVERMAEIIGFTDRTVRNYEADKTPIKRATAISWAFATGVSFEWIWLGGGGDNYADPSATQGYPTVSRVLALQLAA